MSIGDVHLNVLRSTSGQQAFLMPLRLVHGNAEEEIFTRRSPKLISLKKEQKEFFIPS
jgi:hypothetical protein